MSWSQKSAILEEFAKSINAEKIVFETEKDHEKSILLHNLIRSVDKRCGESFTFVNMSSLTRRVKLWQDNLPTIEMFIPIKVNADPILLELLHKLGCGFDIASANELNSCIKIGINPEKIIFSHTVKLKSDFILARKYGVRYSIFDSISELDNHKSLWPEALLLLRINIKDTHGKFGVTIDQVSNLLQYAKNLGLNVVGIHFHVGCLHADITTLKTAFQLCVETITIAKTTGYDLNIINMGGGFTGEDTRHFPMAETHFIRLAHAMRETIQTTFTNHSSLIFFAEPGTFTFMSTMSIAASVLAVRTHNSNNTTNNKESTVNVNVNSTIETNNNNNNTSNDDNLQEIFISDSKYGPLGCLQWEGFSNLILRSMSVIKNIKPDSESAVNQLESSTTAVTAVSSNNSSNINSNNTITNNSNNNTNSEDSKMLKTIIYGCTCDWDDVVLSDITLPIISVGDLLLFDNTGAYAHACSSSFNGMLFSNTKYYFYHKGQGYHKDGFHVEYLISPIEG